MDERQGIADDYRLAFADEFAEIFLSLFKDGGDIARILGNFLIRAVQPHVEMNRVDERSHAAGCVLDVTEISSSLLGEGFLGCQQVEIGLDRADRLLQVMGERAGKYLKGRALLVDTLLHRAMLDGNLDHALDVGGRDRRFCYVILCSLAHRGDSHRFVALSGQHHHGDVRMTGVDTLQHLDSVVPGKRIIQEDAIGRRFLDLDQSSLAILRLNDIVMRIGTLA